jgi:hypothetical protein
MYDIPCHQGYYLRVVYEGTAFVASGRELARSGIFETFDDSLGMLACHESRYGK